MLENRAEAPVADRDDVAGRQAEDVEVDRPGGEDLERVTLRQPGPDGAALRRHQPANGLDHDLSHLEGAAPPDDRAGDLGERSLCAERITEVDDVSERIALVERDELRTAAFRGCLARW